MTSVARPLGRRWLLVSAMLVVFAGLALRGVPGGIGDIAGGVLYTVLVGLVILLVAPAARPATVGVISFAASSAVELLQLTGVPDIVTAVIPAARWVLGSTFAPVDFVAYAVGASLLGWAGTLRAHWTRRRALRRRVE